MAEQTSIRSSRLGRMAAFAGTGARVGINYLKHYGQRSIGSAPDEDDLHERNAEAVYKTFSELKAYTRARHQRIKIPAKECSTPAHLQKTFTATKGR